MLFGEARHSMDAKNRLFIPATQRDDLGAPFMAVPSFRDKCIKLYSMEQWNKYFADVILLSLSVITPGVRWHAR